MVQLRSISLASYELNRAKLEQDRLYKAIGVEEREEMEMEGGATLLSCLFNGTHVSDGRCCRACQTIIDCEANADEEAGSAKAQGREGCYQSLLEGEASSCACGCDGCNLCEVVECGGLCSEQQCVVVSVVACAVCG